MFEVLRVCSAQFSLEEQFNAEIGQRKMESFIRRRVACTKGISRLDVALHPQTKKNSEIDLLLPKMKISIGQEMFSFCG